MRERENPQGDERRGERAELEWVPPVPFLPEGKRWVEDTFKDHDAPRVLEVFQDIAGDMAYRRAIPIQERPTPEQQRAAMAGCIERLAIVIQALEQQDAGRAAFAAKDFEDWRFHCSHVLDGHLFGAMQRLRKADPPLSIEKCNVLYDALRLPHLMPLNYVREIQAALMQYHADMKKGGKIRLNPRFAVNDRVDMKALARLERAFRGIFGDDWKPRHWKSVNRSGDDIEPAFVTAIGHLLKAIGHDKGSALSWATQYVNRGKPPVYPP